MTTVPVRLDRMQAGIVAWLAAVHPGARVLWAPSEWPRAADGTDLVLTARLLSGPDSTPVGGAARPVWELPLTAVARILPGAAGAAGSDVMLRASGRAFEYAIDALDDVEAVRDGLIAATAAGPGPLVSATFEPVDDDEILISALDVGDLYDLGVSAAATGLIELEVLTTETAAVQVADVSALVELQAWTGSRYPRGGAASALSRLIATLLLPTAQAELDRYGLAVTIVDRIVPIDGLAGPQWESRAVLSVRVGMLSVAAEAPLTIARVRGTLIARADPEIEVPIDTGDPDP